MKKNEEYEAMLRDRARLDWLEAQDCLILLDSSDYIHAGKSFGLSVREACDEAMEPKTATPARSGPEPVGG